ncbi:MAG: type II toxin-antitoxin system death-on-curing family toxin [Candidatus Diapherotrites archaeon]|nr:type II toxin-antitoxin system death-on-curing family toxin [Candidatus Diapherotrites archaeon]
MVKMINKKKLIYPSVEKIIELNILSLTIIAVKKADSAKVLSKSKLIEIIKETKNIEGNVYDKTVVLLKGLIQKHAFASGNRRTAFIVAKYFLMKNNLKIKIKDEEKNARVMIGIREGFYSDQEIKEWIQNGKIKEFKR